METPEIVRYGGEGSHGRERPSYKFKTMMDGDFLRVLAMAGQRDHRFALPGSGC